jgi:hypothetical protein
LHKTDQDSLSERKTSANALEKLGKELEEPEDLRENGVRAAVRSKRWKDRNKEEKRYWCDVCQYAAGSPSALTLHMRSAKHKRMVQFGL